MKPNLSDFFPVRRGRTHEVYGPTAHGFAFALAGHLDGTVLWVSENWQPNQINPAGFGLYLDPQRVLLARTKDQTESLAVAEEALRSAAVSLVVMELTGALSLTAGRRLQLAAEAGQSVGLCCVPEGLGSNAAETRWHCSPVFDPSDSTLQRWELKKNKSGTLATWDVRWDATARRINVVSETAQRPGSAGATG